MSSIPLIIENHPDNYQGLPFLTLIKYNNQDFLVVIDNITDGELRLYQIEECEQYGINLNEFLNNVIDWYESCQHLPLSVYLSGIDLTPRYSHIYKSFNIEFVSRAIGPIPKYKLKPISSTKKRKRKQPSTPTKYSIKTIMTVSE